MEGGGEERVEDRRRRGGEGASRGALHRGCAPSPSSGVHGAGGVSSSPELVDEEGGGATRTPPLSTLPCNASCEAWLCTSPTSADTLVGNSREATQLLVVKAAVRPPMPSFPLLPLPLSPLPVH